MSNTDYDVAIVGYGPVGQILATLLGIAGWKVLVVDKQPGLYPLPRACHLDHEAMRILQHAGIADEVVAAMVPAREYHLLRADLTVISDLPRGWETPSGWESSYHFYQPDIEGIFDAAAKATAGVTVRQSVEAIGIQEQADRVNLILASEPLSNESVSATFVVGADGANSFVRTTIGIPQQDLGFKATWVVTDVLLDDDQPRLAVPDTGQVLDPRQPRHMAWLGGNHYRWEFMVMDPSAEGEAADPKKIWPKLGQWVNPNTATLLRSASYTFRSLVATTLNRGRVLLAGDAAHLTPPFMGQGMVAGLRDAATLSWMLDLVLQGVAPLTFLDNYTNSRRPHIIDYIEESVRVGMLICETDLVKAAERDRILSAQTQTPPPFQPPVGGFFQPGPLSGQLAVQPKVSHDGEELLDDILGNHFMLLSTDVDDFTELHSGSDAGASGAPLGYPDGSSALSALQLREAFISDTEATVVQRAWAAAAGVPAFKERGTAFTNWLEAAGMSWVLVRPDGYVYDAGGGAHAAAASIQQLAEVIGETR